MVTGSLETVMQTAWAVMASLALSYEVETGTPQNTDEVYCMAQNIYFEAMGDSPNGSFQILSNGPMTIACQQHLKCAAGAMCVVSAKSLDINAQVNIAGGLTKMKDPDLFSLASNFSWAALMKAITTKCK